MTGGWERPYDFGYRHKLCQERSEWAKVKRFLVADTQLYKRLCPSIGQSVDPSIREHKSKSRKVSAFDASVPLGGAFGPNGGWMPRPTHPQQWNEWENNGQQIIFSKALSSLPSLNRPVMVCLLIFSWLYYIYTNLANFLAIEKNNLANSSDFWGPN